MLPSCTTKPKKMTDMPWAIPIDCERVNSKVLGLLDLSADHPRIVTGVVDPDMVRVTEPRLKRGDNPRRGFTQREITKKGIAAARPVASIRDRTHRDHGP